MKRENQTGLVRNAFDQALCDEVAFDCPAQYNASRILFDNLEHGRGDSRAIISDARTWTYLELCAEANQVGRCLLARGVTPGQRVLMFMDDEAAYPAAVMGAMKAGLVPVLLNTLSPPDLVQYYAEDSEATGAIISESQVELITSANLTRTALHTIIVVGEERGAMLGWSLVRDAPAELREAPTSRNDMAFWMYSSGSTGRPKGIVHRHEDPLYTYASYAKHYLELTPDDICFSVPKLFFAYGFGNSVTFPFCAGAASVLLPARPTPSNIYDQIFRHRPSVLFGLPTLYTALTHDDASKNADLSSVRLCVSAAEVLSAEIYHAWRERFGLEIVEGLGSTEVLHIYLSNDEQHRKLGSAGRRVPGYAVRLRSPDGSSEEDQGDGVLEVRGISNSRKYWNQPEKTRQTMQDGWTWTGDRFERDDEGFYFFKGRADDLVKVSGQWVWPMEIELALAEHPKVHECAVLAIELPDHRITLQAFVVPKPGIDADDQLALELKTYAKRALLPHKYPRTIQFLDRLPKTGTDKIDRQALKTPQVGSDQKTSF